MLYFDQVTLTYKENDSPTYNDSPVLDNISFRIARGEFRYLTGRNGAGKSSLMSLVAMATQPSRGQIRLMGQDVTRCARHQRQALRRKMGVLFQEPRLIDHISVFDNVALPLRLCHISEQNIHTSVIELLKWLDLDHKAYDLPTSLSGGERQAVSLARGVVHRPLLILADEPTAHIDNESSKRILRLLSELNKLGTTVMMATHDRWILESWPRPSLHLEGGKIMQIPSREVFATADSYDGISSAA